MDRDPRWITEQDVVDLVDLPTAIDAVESCLRLEAAGDALGMEKTHVLWDNVSTLHALGAAVPGADIVGTKTWAHTPGGAAPLLTVFDAGDGSVRAVIEAFALGQLRTAAISAIAVKHLARPDVEVAAVIGTGKQAVGQVAAILATRPVRLVRVFSPTQSNREVFVERLRAMGLAANIEAAASVAEATKGAGVVTTVTRATTPVLFAEHLAPGTHVNAVGAITPERREVAADVVSRCGLVVVDAVDAASRLATDLGPVGRDGLTPLCEVVAGSPRSRPDADITLFKAMGAGLADLAVAASILAQAEKEGRGRSFPPPRRQAPRLFGGR